ncbi:muscarinic acetylcholine receptor DM1-like [Asterias rubens]|uniref:muscarinic acetylcholine receptor DM1-like n=1 Tax=Asterias rubens TaxID=7604 RepID=UPI0014551FA6|nr:muscarinic acetylcholine receptor DM1-like [Asterias rubens]
MSLHEALGHHVQEDAPMMGNGTGHHMPDHNNDFAESILISAWILVVVSGILMCVTIPSNFLVLLAFIREKKLRTYVNFFIINLCVSDLCVGLINMPLVMLESVLVLKGKGWPFGHIPCHLKEASKHIFFSTSILTILIICNDRYQAIRHPLSHLQRRTTKGALVRIAVAWGVAFSMWMTFIFVWGVVDGERALPENFCTAMYNTNHYTTGVAIALSLWIPYPLILVMYCRVYRTIQSVSAKAEGKKSKGNGKTPKSCDGSSGTAEKTEFTTSGIGSITQDQIPTVASGAVELKFCCEQNGSPLGQRSDGIPQDTTTAPHHPEKGKDSRLVLFPSTPSYREDKDVTKVAPCISYDEVKLRRSGGIRVEHKKASLTLTLVVVSYAICWLPYGIIAPITSICTMHPGAFPPLPEYFNAAVIAFSMVQSAVNPFCYAAAQPTIRRTVWKILTCSDFSPKLGIKTK